MGSVEMLPCALAELKTEVTMNTATVPVMIRPEAARRIAELDLQVAVQKMIEYALQNLPDLDRIEVVRVEHDEPGMEDTLCIDVYSHHPYDPSERLSSRYTHDLVRLFPPDVLIHLILDYYYGASHAG